MKNSLMGTELFHETGRPVEQTDRHDEANNRFIANLRMRLKTEYNWYQASNLTCLRPTTRRECGL
jgi:hypothetical protein